MTCRRYLNVAFKVLLTLAMLVLMMTPPLRLSNSGGVSTLRSLLDSSHSIAKSQVPSLRATSVYSQAVAHQGDPVRE